MNTEKLIESANALSRDLSDIKPACTVLLGSGWSGVINDLTPIKEIAYESIPHLGPPQVKGHPGRLLLADIDGMQTLFFQGRRHWYEGAGWEPVILPAFIAAQLGCSFMIVTCAVGGIRAGFTPGDIMVIRDHINMMGANPLQGPHDPLLGPRFPDMTHVYDEELRQICMEAAQHIDSEIHQGTYAAVQGPLYETPAEIRALAALGADVVGMSTVPEATVGKAMGLRIAGLSCVANLAAGISEAPLSHDDVVAAIQDAQPGMSRLLMEFLTRLASSLH